MSKKVEDPDLQCPRCEGTGNIDEQYSAGGSYGPKTIARIGTCPDCEGSGRKPDEQTEDSDKS